MRTIVLGLALLVLGSAAEAKPKPAPSVRATPAPVASPAAIRVPPPGGAWPAGWEFWGLADAIRGHQEAIQRARGAESGEWRVQDSMACPRAFAPRPGGSSEGCAGQLGAQTSPRWSPGRDIYYRIWLGGQPVQGMGVWVHVPGPGR